MPGTDDCMKNFEPPMGTAESRASKLDEPHDRLPAPEAVKRAAKMMKMLREARRHLASQAASLSETLPNHGRDADATADL
jgi:hypothetical protein